MVHLTKVTTVFLTNGYLRLPRKRTLLMLRIIQFVNGFRPQANGPFIGQRGFIHATALNVMFVPGSPTGIGYLPTDMFVNRTS